MNVIFVDFDGTLYGFHDDINKNINASELLEKRVAILAEMCKKYNCKVVILASAKTAIDEETMEINQDATWIKDLFVLFAKYGIECIGRTPNVSIRINEYSYLDMWKEFEIMKWLYRHPEVEHYCVLDDNDTKNLYHWKRSDLEKVSNHLVETCYYNKENPELEGLLPEHVEEVGKVLKLNNEIQRLALRRKRK